MNDTKQEKFVGTLEQQRVVNAVLSAVALLMGKPGEALRVSTDPRNGDEFVRVDQVIEDVVLALNVQEDTVRLALDSALTQGLLVTPPSLPRSEHPAILVRPATL